MAVYAAVLVVLVTAGVFLAARLGQGARAVRVMPLGDSITGTPGCWRALLWQRLQDTGHTDVDFVGTLPDPGCGAGYDGDNEGHGGFRVVAVANDNLLPGWLSATHPDIVLMHFGTNDVWWGGASTAQILDAYTTLLGQLRADNPRITLLIAQILPIESDNCADCGQRVVELNAAIPGWASAHSTAESPITVVDQWTGFDPAADTREGVHPNDQGERKIAERWYPALAEVLSRPA
ncbi:GDSL-like Lipase/Acylhydrolase family protein [Goodfellowiella coeruleoviolacea]|uniref:GDSL-like Lipase/Acylhydrolase family protein n=1 Tax=Goodfellowiella coeruleoviolacea TaxID=334858 RepID=A0AAE3GEH4_9PSEU|nr:GDSL-like Lipase/Acylhydrolase family protein [Goodfellowiella coeruleoviolacea]